MSTITVETELAVVECCICSIHFAMPKLYQQNLRRTHEWFYCPNGHVQHYSGKSDLEKAQDQLNAKVLELQRVRNYLAEEKESRLAAERSVIAQKAAKTRLKNRIANGVCPCCHRTFQNLHNHMKKQHPAYTEPKEA